MADKDRKALASSGTGLLNTPSNRQEPDKGAKIAGCRDESSHTSQFHSRAAYQHHLHGHSIPSDAYLRQALTSPYNQRSEKQSSTSSSPCDGRNREAGMLYSPSLWRERVAQIQSSPQLDSEKASQVSDHGMRHHHVGEPVSPGADAHFSFKTPQKSIKRAVFTTPDKAWQERAMSIHSSPSSSISGSGSSSSGHHTNPFEQGHDRLHFPMFSPGMFSMPPTPGSVEKTFQWNLEHIAELRPVHIDDKDIKRQMSRKNQDEEVEQRAQKAIDYYFRHHMVAPSPWSEPPPPHVLPITPAHGQGYEYEGMMAVTPDDAKSAHKEFYRRRKLTDKSCQTTLTLPLDFDLEKALGDYMTYQDSDRDESVGKENISSSSLRRRLCFQADSSSILSPVRPGEMSPDHLSAALCTPPKKSTPEWERGSPVHTPSSIQFSSSPIRGPVRTEGDYLRLSFSEHVPLASPQLSPIPDEERARPKLSLGFPAMSIETEDGLEFGFGSQVRKQLQMEVHDGSSPRRLPSPNMSPIAASGGSSSPHTLRAQMSQDIFASPRRASAGRQRDMAFSPSPVPFTSFGQNPPQHRDSVSMDTDVDFVSVADKDRVLRIAGDTSTMDLVLGDGSNITHSMDHDTLQNPSSCSNPDTGYQTGSGNGSLQTTQEGGFSITTNTSTEAPSCHSDSSLTHKRLPAKPHPTVTEHMFSVKGQEETRAMSVDDSSVDGMGSSVDCAPLVHSNLTSQFMRMPVYFEQSTDSTDFNASQHSHHEGASVDGQGFAGILIAAEQKNIDMIKSSFSTITKDPSTLTVGGMTGTDSDIVSDCKLECGLIPKLDLHHMENNFVQEDSMFSAQGRYFHEHDPEFLKKMGEYLEKGEASDDSDERGTRAITAPSSSIRGDHERRRADDSVIERARQYLDSVNYPENRLEAEQRKQSAVVEGPPPMSDSGPSPGTRLLGKVVEDLSSGGGAKNSSPALGSEVAKEILRRAQLDLKRVDGATLKTHQKVDSG